MKEMNKFNVVVVGIIYNPKEKKILIGRRENDPHIKELEWCFPGGRLSHGEEVDKTLKKHIKEKTGYDVKNLGSIFTKIENSKKDLVITYFLTEVFKGEEKPGKNISELKWVSPKELEKIFKTSFNSRLKEYLINLM